MTLRAKLVVILVVLGCVVSLGYSLFVYRRAVGQAHTDAEAKADELIERSVEMFMVSTRKFHDEWQDSLGDPNRRQEVLDDWNRTIFAVDEAVIHDFGAETPRVRLIGDERVVGFPPLGGANTRIEIPFEEEAVRAFRGGQTSYEKLEDDVLRVSVPLMAQAHPGCAECHFAKVEGLDADTSRDALLGTLNAYLPMQSMLQTARDDAVAGIVSLAGVMAALVAFMYFFISRYVVTPIQAIARSLLNGAGEVTHAASQVGGASQSLAEGATEQAAGLEQTSSSLEEMASMTKQNADNAQQANTLAGEARQSADTGTQSMSRMNAAIEDIQRSSDETAKIIKVIDEIAFQTNLLALNAAVEAARAGEAGKGFAVVAEEVRNLAMRSAEAAKDTARMIEESVKNARSGVDIAAEVGKVLDDIVQGVGKTTDLIGEIAAASQEQAQGIDQVNTAVAQMDKVTQQNAANAEESASASEELKSQAQSMNEIVGQLVALVGNKGQQTGSAPTIRPVRRGDLGHSDRILHTIAHGPTRKGRRGGPSALPGKGSIPLGEDEDRNE